MHIMAKPILYLDFEFYGSNERILNLVCCAAYDTDIKCKKQWWLWDNECNKNTLKQYLLDIRDTHILCCYGAIAEARSLISLGLDPSQFKWIDLFLEVRQLQNCCDKFEFGTYFDKTGKKRKSTPPKRDERGMVIEDGKDHFMLEQGLTAAVACFLEEYIDSGHKTAMRDRILAGGPYSEWEQGRIEEYCASDVEILPRLWERIRAELLATFYPGKPGDMAKAVFSRGAYAADCATMEANGIPLDMPRLYSISEKHQEIINEMIRVLCEDYYPFFVKEKVKGGFRWVQKYSAIKKFIEDRGLADKWSLTEGGVKGIKNFSTDEKTLESNSHIPELKEFLRTRKAKNSLNAYRPEALPEFMSNVGSDYRLRVWGAPYATQTSRSAPRSSVFIPAQASWLRSLIRPRPGYAISVADYSSAEFIIASAVSGDEVMQEAYNSSDPYLFFAKSVGAAPQDATKTSHEAIRDLFKATILGLSYSMGVVKLREKLCYDTKQDVSIERATELRDSFRDTFQVYTEWVWETRNAYSAGEILRLPDGWCLGPDNPSSTSVSNFPIQGCGAVIMRRAVRLCLAEGIEILYTLHDALSCLHEESDTKTPARMRELMLQAFKEICGCECRVDLDTYPHNKRYLPKKGAAMYKQLEHFFDEPLEDFQRDLLG
jgi:hypothetical protein